jgi:16S rRNA (cytosine1402-N4)-methyltransferase
METPKPDYHIPVLLPESVAGLAIREGGMYVDATYGGGGHSRLILDSIPKGKGKLIAFDRDVDAQANIPKDKNFTLIHSEFTHIKNFLRYLDIDGVDGILADLGISSHQIDSPERGFSFRYDAPLDMRMDVQSPVTAFTLVNEESAERLQSIFSEYGEVRNAKTLAEAIVRHRKVSPIATTAQLADIADEVKPYKEPLRKYLAPVFQALRIAVNDELEGLKNFLSQCLDVLKPGGRLVVITYHSLEDRIVKNFIQDGNHEGAVEKDAIFGSVVSPWKNITKKPILPDEQEINRNPRARSAKLRIAEKR